MAEIDPAAIARIVIPEFLRELMRAEQKGLGDELATVLNRAGMSKDEWLALETGQRRLSKEQWCVLAVFLRIGPADIALRLHESISSRPAVWIERRPDGTWQILHRQVTSPRALRSGNTVNADLNGNRPALFYELSSYYPSPEEIISFAAQGNYLTPRMITHPPPSPPAQAGDARSSLHTLIDDLPDEHLPLLERVLDKFGRYPLKDLAQAYKHFALSVTKK